jgi:CRP/FNR family transcriptional regulator
MAKFSGEMSVSEILKNCSFFSEVSGESLRRLTAMALRRRFRRGQLIFRQGDDVPGVFVIATGKVKVFNVAVNGKEHVLHLLGPGDTFAEVAALGGFACPAFAEALQETTCVLLPTQPFNQALRQDHRLSLQILRSMAAWMRYFVGLLEGIVLRDAAGRIADYLLRVERDSGRALSLPSLKKHIASHLNLTSETLSRTLRRLREDGLIGSAPGNRIVIKDRRRLQQVAEGHFPAI